MRKFICFCFAVAVLAVGNVTLVQQAQARWKPAYADSMYREWFAQQHDGSGWSCCDGSDAHPIYDAYTKQGKWHVVIHGRDYEIHPGQLLDGSNPTGHAVIWYNDYGDQVIISCFAPGPMY